MAKRSDRPESLARFIVAAARFFVRLPKFVLVAVLGLAERLARRAGAGETELAPLVEIKEIFRDDPKGREAVRRMIGEGRDSLLVSTVAGALKHYRRPPADPVSLFAQARVHAERVAPATARVAFFGEHFEFAPLKDAYAAAGLRVVGDKEHPLVALGEVDAAEIALAGAESREWVNAALAKGVAVSLHPGQTSAEDLLVFFSKARQYDTPLRVFYPYLHYRPVQQIAALLAAGEIGEPSQIRVRATLGGPGAAARLDPPFGENPLAHPAFDHFLLLTLWGGPAAELSAYVQPMDETTGGQAMIAVRFAAPGRLGMLECTWAPGLHLRSDFYPHDLDAEICGTDGIIWLRRGMAERTHAAPVAVRAGMTAYTIGVERGQNEAWAGVYTDAAGHLREMIAGRTVEHLTLEQIVTARRLAQNVAAAASSREVIRL
jgi:predicted dehydrogenase